MAAKTQEEKALEQQRLKDLSPYSLPDNPSQKGWSGGQIKSKLYKGLFYLYNLLDETRTDVSNVEQALDELDLEDFVTENEAQEIKDSAMPHIGETPPNTNNTKIWIDTRNDEDIINAETVETPLFSFNRETQQIFNENFEPIYFSNDDNNELLQDTETEQLDNENTISFDSGDNNNNIYYEE